MNDSFDFKYSSMFISSNDCSFLLTFSIILLQFITLLLKFVQSMLHGEHCNKEQLQGHVDLSLLHHYHYSQCFVCSLGHTLYTLQCNSRFIFGAIPFFMILLFPFNFTFYIWYIRSLWVQKHRHELKHNCWYHFIAIHYSRLLLYKSLESKIKRFIFDAIQF